MAWETWIYSSLKIIVIILTMRHSEGGGTKAHPQLLSPNQSQLLAPQIEHTENQK
jgi:hypothetical protein